MTTTPTPRNNMEKTFADLRASDERRRARMSPEQKKVAAAAALTPKEQAELDAAYAAVAEAQAAMSDIMLRKGELEALTQAGAEEWTATGGLFSRLVNRPPDPARAAAAKAELDDYPLREEVARGLLQVAVRTTNHVEKKVSAARAKRRYDMEAKLAPPFEKPVMRSDPWQQTTERRYGQGGG